MVDVNTYYFKLLTYNKVKLEEFSINECISKFLDSKGTINSTRRIRRILDVKYERDDLNKSMDEQCQHLSPNKREIILQILEKMRVCLMEHWVRGNTSS